MDARAAQADEAIAKERCVPTIIKRLFYVLLAGTATWAAFRFMGWGVATVEGLLAYWGGAMLMATDWRKVAAKR